MATENPLNAFFAKLPEGFPIDKDATAGAWKSWAKLNERLADLAIDGFELVRFHRGGERQHPANQEACSRRGDPELARWALYGGRQLHGRGSGGSSDPVDSATVPQFGT